MFHKDSADFSAPVAEWILSGAAATMKADMPGGERLALFHIPADGRFEYLYGQQYETGSGAGATGITFTAAAQPVALFDRENKTFITLHHFACHPVTGEACLGEHIDDVRFLAGIRTARYIQDALEARFAKNTPGLPAAKPTPLAVTAYMHHASYAEWQSGYARSLSHLTDDYIQHLLAHDCGLLLYLESPAAFAEQALEYWMRQHDSEFRSTHLPKAAEVQSAWIYFSLQSGRQGPSAAAAANAILSPGGPKTFANSKPLRDPKVSTIKEARARVRRLRSLDEEWKAYGAPPIPDDVLDAVDRILDVLPFAPAVQPTTESSVQLEFENERLGYLGLEIVSGSKVQMLRESPAGDIEERRLDPGEVWMEVVQYLQG